MVLAVLVILLWLHGQNFDHELGPDLVLLGAIWIEVLLWIQRLPLKAVKPLLLPPRFLCLRLVLVQLICLETIIIILIVYFASFLFQRAHSIVRLRDVSYVQVRAGVGVGMDVP